MHDCCLLSLHLLGIKLPCNHPPHYVIKALPFSIVHCCCM